jgi:2-desacetyl-2-hydroxyethyl bacteriochlorophyllide A dehydrogenase
MGVKDIPVPAPEAGELLIRVMASGICGTDVHIFRGDYLGSYPVVPGHEFAGVVEETGAGVTNFRAGDRVSVEPNLSCGNCIHCRNNRQNFCENWQAVGVTRPGGMAEYVLVPESAVFGIGSLPFEQAAFMEPLSCVLHGLERLEPESSARIAVVGAGPIGLLWTQVLRSCGASEITMVEQDPDRRTRARSLGADHTAAGLDELKRDSFDALVDATGNTAAMERTTDFVRPGGKILLFGVPPADSRLSMDAFAVFRKGLPLLSSYTSLRNSQQALDRIADGSLRIDALISHRLPLDGFTHGIELLESRAENVCKVMILPSSVRTGAGET